MRRRVGMITPSSNSVLEPVTAAMLAGRSDVTAHFARLRVTEIALGRAGAQPVRPGHMLPAADLLADAKVGSIAWNGTSASWLGIERDERSMRGDCRQNRYPGDDLDIGLSRRDQACERAAGRDRQPLYR